MGFLRPSTSTCSALNAYRCLASRDFSICSLSARVNEILKSPQTQPFDGPKNDCSELCGSGHIIETLGGVHMDSNFNFRQLEHGLRLSSRAVKRIEQCWE